ncbi:MAG: hypothetical protein JO061_13060, partial [Acidobacteriaceae bacterium]|nr:hypothetical protein [Acidobacteriaceae bacterium]
MFRAKWFGLSVATIGAALLVRAEFVPGSDDTVAGSALESALFRIMGLPDGTVIHSRPAWEAKKHLTELLQKSANDADLLSLRAREEELLQDYANAEADWQSAAEKSQDGIGARTELAAFYGRRNQPREQISALLELGGLPQQPDQRDQPPADSPQWKAFGEAEFVAHSAQLPPSQETAIYEAWIKRYPENVEPYQSYLNWQLGQKNLAGAKAMAARMKAAFPHNRELALTTDASLARLQGGTAAALEVYARNFS